MTSSNPRDPSSLRRASPGAALRQRLQQASPAQRYDVEAGLARHRELVGQGATPPEWARSMGRVRRVGQPWLLSVLAGLALLGAGAAWLSVSRERSPDPPAAAASRPGSALHVQPLAPDVRGLPAPRTEPAPRDTLARAPQAAEPVALSHESAADPSAERSPVRVVPARPTRVQPVVRSEDPGAVRAEPRRAPAARSEEAPSREPAVSPLPADLVAELAAGAAGSQATAEATQPAEPVHSPAPEAIDPEVLDEMQQLASAERLLPTMPSRTLAMVREGMQRFPHGYLAQERRYLEIMALLALKKPKDAELLSRSFLRDYPRGPYRRKVERALEESTRD